MIKELSLPEVKQFIKEHENDDPADLVLKYSGKTTLPLSLIAGQIQSRKKAKKKLPLLYRNPDIIFPIGVSLEQCSSEVTASYKARIIQGNSLTDLTGGFGVDSLSLAQTFGQVNHVEPNPELQALASYNFQLLEIQNIKSLQSTAEDYLNKEESTADVYFIDPSRRDEKNQKVFQLKDCQPNLEELLPTLTKRKSEVLIKLSPLVDIQSVLSQIPNVKEVHVVSVRNECKEVLFKVSPSGKKDPPIIAIDIYNNEEICFEFSLADEERTPKYGLPLTYLYEPNASVMKAGAYNSIASTFSLSKLHRNSHLYTSDTLIDNFPGRKFRIEKQVTLSKKHIRRAVPGGKSNLTVRNYPESVEEIRKRTGLKEGGDTYLFATTLFNESLVGLVCKRI